MADWGNGARSDRKSPPPPLKYRMTFLICSRCGNAFWLKHLYDSDLRHVEDEFGKPVCERCRKKEPTKRKGTPPPESVQMTMDEVLNAKK